MEWIFTENNEIGWSSACVADFFAELVGWMFACFSDSLTRDVYI
jgi:hypothetical protein